MMSESPTSVSIFLMAFDSLDMVSASAVFGKRSPAGLAMMALLSSASWRYRLFSCSSRVMVMDVLSISHPFLPIQLFTVMRDTPTRSAISCCVRFSFR